jgi:Fe-S cluster biosynthesis and repair protein YggX
MSRTVFCKKYQKELPGLPLPPYPGAKGQDLFDNVSAQAWQDWQKQQVMLINEKHLSMASAEDRRYLQEQMDRFFANESFDSASGYVAPDSEADPKPDSE